MMLNLPNYAIGLVICVCVFDAIPCVMSFRGGGGGFRQTGQGLIYISLSAVLSPMTCSDR